MCFPKAPKPPEPDPAIARMQEAQRFAEAQRVAELKKKQLERAKTQLPGGGEGGSGVRSLISGTSGSGYGRNFF